MAGQRSFTQFVAVFDRLCKAGKPVLIGIGVWQVLVWSREYQISQTAISQFQRDQTNAVIAAIAISTDTTDRGNRQSREAIKQLVELIRLQRLENTELRQAVEELTEELRRRR